jgi:hypothetical protein
MQGKIKTSLENCKIHSETLFKSRLSSTSLGHLRVLDGAGVLKMAKIIIFRRHHFWCAVAAGLIAMAKSTLF